MSVSTPGRPVRCCANRVRERGRLPTGRSWRAATILPSCRHENTGPGAYCPDHRTGVKFRDVVVTPLQYVD